MKKNKMDEFPTEVIQTLKFYFPVGIL